MQQLTGQTLGPLDILLVEDNPGDVLLTTKAFEAEGISIQAVGDGQDALEYLLDENTQLPHIILLDLNLPGMSGTEVLLKIRSIQRLSRLPVIVLSSSYAEDDRARSYDAQVNAYLAKPKTYNAYSALAAAVQGFWQKWNLYPPARK